MENDNNDNKTPELTQKHQQLLEGMDAEYKVLRLDELIPDPNNPRVHTQENIQEIAHSIETLGFNNPIQVVPLPDDDKHYRIVAGHGRYEAMKLLGVDVIPSVILKHLEGDDARALAANIADNEIALHSFYDEEKLATALNTLQEMSESLVEASGIDMDRFLDIAYGNAMIEEDGFELNDTSVKDFKNQVEGSDNKFTEYQDANLKAGDVFVLGDQKHRLMFGDPTEASDMEKLMDGEDVRLLVTDVRPMNKGEKRAKYQACLTEEFGIARELMRGNENKGGNFYILYPNEVTLEVLNALEDAKLFREQNLVWVRNNLQITGRYDYRIQHENIAFGATDDDYNTVMHQDIAYGFTEKKIKSWNNDKKQPTAIQIDTTSTTKPLKLVGYFIKNHLDVNDNMLDLLAGNGTGLIACEQLHRRYFGIDNDKDAVLTSLCRFASDTHYKQPIINERTGKDIVESLKELVK